MSKSSFVKEPPDRPKAVLFCPECTHEGELTKDWIHESNGSTEIITCPNCGSEILRNQKRRPIYC